MKGMVPVMPVNNGERNWMVPVRDGGEGMLADSKSDGAGAENGGM